VPDLLWDDVRDWFDPHVNGVLPDLHVPDTTLADWQAIADLVRSKGWAYEYSVDGRVTRLPADVSEMLSRREEAGVTLKVWPTDDVLAIFRPYCADQGDFDCGPPRVAGQERLDSLCELLRAIGRRLHKPVVMTPEGAPDILVGYDVAVDRMVLLDGQSGR
jgi:hypothetical protein